MFGKGKLTYPKNDKIKFLVGNFVNLNLNGIGYIEYVSGKTYHGSLLKGRTSGYGKLNFSGKNENIEYYEG